MDAMDGNFCFRFSLSREGFFLSSGVTMASYRVLGMVNSMRDLFTILQIVGQSTLSTSLSRDVGIGSRSHDLEFEVRISMHDNF